MEYITEEVLISTQQYWYLETKSIYHECVSLIISQKISFKESRRIRSILYQKIGEYEFTFDNLRTFSETELSEFGLNSKMQSIIMSIPENITNIDELKNLYGVGIWTVNALKIKFTDEDIFLSEDLWIRKHIKLLLELDYTPTITEVKHYSDKHIPINKSIITLFLWRLKHTSVGRLIKGEQLNKDDFI